MAGEAPNVGKTTTSTPPACIAARRSTHSCSAVANAQLSKIPCLNRLAACALGQIKEPVSATIVARAVQRASAPHAIRRARGCGWPTLVDAILAAACFTVQLFDVAEPAPTP